MKWKLVFLMIFCLSTLNSSGQTLLEKLDYGDKEREYLLHIPENFDETEPVPLVIALHGLTNTGQKLLESSKFDLVADTANFLVAFPTAWTNGTGVTAWNNGLSVGSGEDDTGFLRELIKTISEEYNVNSRRIYFTGFSMGGFMSNKMACEFSYEIAAIASHSGTMSYSVFEDCLPSRPFPMMHIHGTGDFVVSYDGNWFGGFESVDSLMNLWRNHNNCPNEYTIIELEDTQDDGIYIEKSIFDSCDEGIELWLYTAYNHNHSWLQPENDVFASREIWEFFKMHELPESYLGLQDGLKEQEEQVLIYPNPVSDRLNFEFENQESIFKLELYNSYGILLKDISLEKTSVSLRNQPSGLYLLRVNGQQSIPFIKH